MTKVADFYFSFFTSFNFYTIHIPYFNRLRVKYHIKSQWKSRNLKIYLQLLVVRVVMFYIDNLHNKKIEQTENIVLDYNNCVSGRGSFFVNFVANILNKTIITTLVVFDADHQMLLLT